LTKNIKSRLSVHVSVSLSFKILNGSKSSVKQCIRDIQTHHPSSRLKSEVRHPICFERSLLPKHHHLFSSKHCN